jgi:hypothetical protein
MRSSAANEIARYSRIHCDTYGLDHIPCHMVHTVSESLCTLLEELNNPDVKEAFIELSRLVLALSKRMKAGEDTLHNLQRKANELNVPLPNEVLDFFGRDKNKEVLRLPADSPGVQEEVASWTRSGSASPSLQP